MSRHCNSRHVFVCVLRVVWPRADSRKTLMFLEIPKDATYSRGLCVWPEADSRKTLLFLGIPKDAAYRQLENENLKMIETMKTSKAIAIDLTHETINIDCCPLHDSSFILIKSIRHDSSFILIKKYWAYIRRNFRPASTPALCGGACHPHWSPGSAPHRPGWARCWGKRDPGRRPVFLAHGCWPSYGQGTAPCTHSSPPWAQWDRHV